MFKLIAYAAFSLFTISCYGMNAAIGQIERFDNKDYVVTYKYESNTVTSVVMERVTQRICGIPFKVAQVQTDYIAGQHGWASFYKVSSDYSRHTKAFAIACLLTPATLLVTLLH